MLEISATILHPDGPDSSDHDSKAAYWIVLEQDTKSLRGEINEFGFEGLRLSVERNENSNKVSEVELVHLALIL